jgi:prepilin-type N-terminal cleavage/methylation domain-containing protein
MKRGFTLIELLVVIVIIGILATLTIGASTAIREKSKRSRTTTEVAAFDVALENFKIDNGDYPDVSSSKGLFLTGKMYNKNPEGYVGDAATVHEGTREVHGRVTGGSGARFFFACLTGRAKFSDYTQTAYPQYLEVKPNQVASPREGENYFKDVYGNPYGYYYDATSQTSLGSSENQKSLFNIVQPDVWSTGGQSIHDPDPSPDSSNARGYAVYLKWIKNWSSQ